MASSVTADPSGVNGVEEIDAGNSTGSTTQATQTPQTTTQTPSHSDGPLARTPSLSSFSLTEYSAKPVASVDRNSNIKKIVPDELLLPNGYPDVSHPDLHRPYHREECASPLPSPLVLKAVMATTRVLYVFHRTCD